MHHLRISLLCSLQTNFHLWSKNQHSFGLFVVSYIQVGMYFLVRFGLFSSTVVAFVYQTVVAYVLLVIAKTHGISLHSRRLFVYETLSVGEENFEALGYELLDGIINLPTGYCIAQIIKHLKESLG